MTGSPKLNQSTGAISTGTADTISRVIHRSRDRITKENRCAGNRRAHNRENQRIFRRRSAAVVRKKRLNKLNHDNDPLLTGGKLSHLSTPRLPCRRTAAPPGRLLPRSRSGKRYVKGDPFCTHVSNTHFYLCLSCRYAEGSVNQR